MISYDTDTIKPPSAKPQRKHSTVKHRFNGCNVGLFILSKYLPVYTQSIGFEDEKGNIADMVEQSDSDKARCRDKKYRGSDGEDACLVGV